MDLGGQTSTHSSCSSHQSRAPKSPPLRSASRPPPTPQDLFPRWRGRVVAAQALSQAAYDGGLCVTRCFTYRSRWSFRPLPLSRLGRPFCSPFCSVCLFFCLVPRADRSLPLRRFVGSVSTAFVSSSVPFLVPICNRPCCVSCSLSDIRHGTFSHRTSHISS
jgi:hypothetical protein